MSQINKITIIGLLFLAGSLSLAGCSSSNSESSFDADSREHRADWQPAGHVSAANTDINSCAECHGSDFGGGISGVPCTECHLGDERTIHPLAWGQLTATIHSAYVESNGNTSCSNAACHGTELSGVSGSGPSCTSCHIGGVSSVHPEDWGDIAYYKHSLYSAASGTTSCSNAACHGADLSGVSGSGPSCTSCHIGGIYSVHPAEWDADITLHRLYVAARGSSSCANITCHGANLEGVYASGPSCFACH